ARNLSISNPGRSRCCSCTERIDSMSRSEAVRNRLFQTLIVVAVGLTAIPAVVFATPSTTYWAPSTASCQARGVPHITYDTYFWKGPAAGSAEAKNYPMDTGLTVGFLPYQKIQGEVGFDLLLSSQDPLFLNAKLCTPESSLFAGSPGISFGIYNVGFNDDVSNFGTNVYFADNVSLLVGPVFFLDKDLQPGGSKYMWTAQLDVDIPLGR